MSSNLATLNQNLIELNQNFNNDIYKMININNDTIKNLIHLLFPENLIIAMSPSLLIPKSVEQISFLQKKRALENNNINYNDNIRVQKNNNFIISNQGKIKIEEKPGNIRTNLDLPLQLIKIQMNYITYLIIILIIT